MRRLALGPVARRLRDATATAVLTGRGAPSPLAAHGVAFTTTSIARFDIRKHEMEKRRLRELEKAGIDPNDDDEPWIAPEEQQRLDEEEQARQAEEEARRQEFLAKRAEEDAAKRQKFKQFRAKQIAMSRHRKEAVAEQKAAGREQRAQGRTVEEGGGDAAEQPPQPSGDSDGDGVDATNASTDEGLSTEQDSTRRQG